MPLPVNPLVIQAATQAFSDVGKRHCTAAVRDVDIRGIHRREISVTDSRATGLSGNNTVIEALLVHSVHEPCRIDMKACRRTGYRTIGSAFLNI